MSCTARDDEVEAQQRKEKFRIAHFKANVRISVFATQFCTYAIGKVMAVTVADGYLRSEGQIENLTFQSDLQNVVLIGRRQKLFPGFVPRKV